MKERASSVEEMLKKSAEKKSEAEKIARANETLKKASQVLHKKSIAEEQRTGRVPDDLTTEEFKVNGHSVQFGYRREDSGDFKLYGKIDGKIYEDSALKEMILKVDGVGLSGKEQIKHNIEQKKAEMAKNLKKDMPVLRRTAAISVARGAAQAAKNSERGGESIMAKLIAILGRSVSGPMR